MRESEREDCKMKKRIEQLVRGSGAGEGMLDPSKSVKALASQFNKE